MSHQPNDLIAVGSSTKTTPFTHRGLTLLSAADFKGLSPVDWLVDGVLPRKGLASLYGASGAGKSFVTLDLAASIAAALPWFGHRVRQSRVVNVVLEGQSGVPGRTRAWANLRNMDFPNNVNFLFDGIALNTETDVVRLAELIANFNGADLVIIDTLNRAAPGADENSSLDMNRLIAGATALQQAVGGLVLLVHHSGKEQSRGLRGHSSLHAALDAVIEVERDGDRRSWKLAKSKDGREGIRHGFELAISQIGTNEVGEPITSCAVVEKEDNSPPTRYAEPRGANQRLVLNALRAMSIDRKPQDVDDHGAQGIPFDDAIDHLQGHLGTIDTKHRRERVKEALDSLIENGYLNLVNQRLSLALD